MKYTLYNYIIEITDAGIDGTEVNISTLKFWGAIG